MPENSALRILLACGRPLITTEEEPLNIARMGAEIDAVKRGLEGISREIHVSVHDAATLPGVNRLFLNAETEFDVLHFIGHGGKGGALYFEDSCGIARRVAPDDLAMLVRGRVKLLVTMACYSQKVVDPLFSDDTAVSAAVCIHGEQPIQARAAEVFSGALYSGLARGKTLKVSFDDAVNAVRIDDWVGEEAMPHTDDDPTPWKRFVLKGDGKLSFPDVPEGSLNIEEVIRRSPHKKMPRTDELFIGRNKDIAAIAQLLEPPSDALSKPKPRIITLSGEGGIGKTRLAQAAAEWLADRGRFPGGIFEIPCEEAQDAPGLAIAMLKGLGVAKAESVSDPADDLTTRLARMEERTLLVLDNLDDLFAEDTDSGEAGNLLKECLTACPNLNIMVTCRWPMELGWDEHAFTVDPMSQQYAMELFIQCIPDPEIQHEIRLEVIKGTGSEAFERIIELTDRMPLYIILAARRLRIQGKTLDALLNEAEDDLMGVMNDPKLRSLPPRLKSLAASIDLSYRHISEPARKLFARMSFFPGGLSRELDLFELLGDGWENAAENLTSYALARYDREADRYTMLNSVREYAERKLDETEGDEFRRQAAEYWVEFARWHDLMINVQPSARERLAQQMNLPDDPEEKQKAHEELRLEGFAALMAEEINLVHAVEWALDAEEETGLGMVNSLQDYLELRARWYTKERLYRLALSLRRQLVEDNPEEYLPDLAATLNNMGVLHYDMGHPDEALKHYEEALGIRRELSDTHPDAYLPDVAMTLNNMGVLRYSMGNPDEALKHYEEALGIYRKLSDTHPDVYLPDVAMTLNNMGALYAQTAHPDEALKHFEEALRIRRELSDTHPDAYLPYVAGTLNNMGALYAQTGHPDKALKHYEEALGIYRKLSDTHPDVYLPDVAMTLNNMGALYAQTAHPDEALKHFEEALGIRRELSDTHPDAYLPDVAMTLNNMGNVYAQTGYPDEALKHYDEALGIYRKLSETHPDAYLPVLADTLNNMGVLLKNMDHPDEALKQYEEALGIYREFYGRYPSAHARNFLTTLRGAAAVYEKLGMAEKAAECKKEIEKVRNCLSSQN